MTDRRVDYDMLAYFDGSHADVNDVGAAVDALELDLPDLELPDLELPDLELPDLELPDLELPDLELPDLKLSDLEGHHLDVPHFDGSDFDRSNVGAGTSWEVSSQRQANPHGDRERRLQRDRRRERLVAFEISARTAHLFRHATRS